MSTGYSFPLFGCMAIIGSRGSGKTVLLKNMLENELAAQYDSVHIISPTCQCPDQQELFAPLHIPPEHFHEDMDPSTLDTLINQNKIEKKNILIVMDDMAFNTVGRGSWKNSTSLNRLAALGRHYSVGLILLVQYACNLSKAVRGNCDAFIVFRIDDIDEIKILHKEGGGSLTRDFQFFVRILDYATTEAHSYFVLDKRHRCCYKKKELITILP